MVKPDRQALEVMARLGYDAKAFVEFLKARLVEYDENLRNQPDEVQLRILQGRAQEVSGILDLINKAPELIRKA